MSRNPAGDNQRRKKEHLGICLTEEVEFQATPTGFEAYRFLHNALPEIDLADVDLEVTFLGKRLRAPLLISCMTGGTEEARGINRILAGVAQEMGIAMGVGSQRVALEDPAVVSTYQIRDVAPDILLFANLGAVQLNNGCSTSDCLRVVEMVGADALVLHLNPLQECVQRSGNTEFGGLIGRIEALCGELPVPVVVKEVGHGVSGRAARRLRDAGVAAIDVAGAGGTSWARVEGLREDGTLGDAFAEWGIPTADCIRMARRVAPEIELIGSGGVRSGIDVAKAIALGANIAGLALPLLREAVKSGPILRRRLEEIRAELATALFCIGARTPTELRNSGALVHVCPACGLVSDPWMPLDSRPSEPVHRDLSTTSEERRP